MLRSNLAPFGGLGFGNQLPNNEQERRKRKSPNRRRTMTLSDLRIQHAITQEEIAKQTSIAYNTYRRYEYNQTFPSAKAICALAKLYGMSPGDLFESLCREKGFFP